MPTKKKINRKNKPKAVTATRELRVSVSSKQRLEIRTNADGSRTISGYAVVFNSLSEDLGGFREKIAPGAFTNSLRDNPDVMCLYGHDSNQILGRVSSGSLSVKQDDTGLKFTCKLPDTSTARDLISLMERGDLSSMSFGFACVDDKWSDVAGQLIREVREALLFEISVVGQPAYAESSVSLRSLPAEFRSRVNTRSSDYDSDDNDDSPECDPDSPDYDPDQCDEDSESEDRCECRCGLEGCASRSDEDDEERNRAIAATLLLRRISK